MQKIRKSIEKKMLIYFKIWRGMSCTPSKETIFFRLKRFSEKWQCNSIKSLKTKKKKMCLLPIDHF